MKVVIVGGGYAGASAASSLRRHAGRNGLEVELVNRHSFHYLTTLLHNAAAWHRGAGFSGIHLPTLLGPRIAFHRGSVQRVDAERKVVHVLSHHGPSEMTYDRLILAPGWEPTMPKVAGLSKHSMSLTDLESALAIHDAIEKQVAGLDEHPEQSWRYRVVIGGAGFTGVELASALRESGRRIARDFDLRAGNLDVVLVDGHSTVLHGFEPHLIKGAQRRLKQLGVRLELGSDVTSVGPHSVHIGSKVVEAGTVVWAGGIRASRLIASSGLRSGHHGRAVVDASLRADGHPDIYVTGDSALATTSDGQIAKQTAQCAESQGRCAARNVLREMRGKPPARWHFRSKGQFVSLGRKDAVGYLRLGKRHFAFHGQMARLLKSSANTGYRLRIGGIRFRARKGPS